MAKAVHAKRKKAFQLRLERIPISKVAKQLSCAHNTIKKWEDGWIDKAGRRHKGWKEKLEQLWQEQEDEELKCGLMLKKERLKTYDKLARMAIEKIESLFPEIKAKTGSDMKALLSEVRELCRLIAIEKGEYPSGGNKTLIAVKTDISLPDLERRYKDATGNHQEEDTE